MYIRVRTTSAARPAKLLDRGEDDREAAPRLRAASPGVEEPSGSTGAVPETRMRLPERSARVKP